MGVVTKIFSLKDLDRNYIDTLLRSYDVPQDSPFVIKGITLSQNEMKFDENECSSIDVLTTKSVDRDGEIVEPSGIVLDVFRKHPVCVWCHDYKQLPVGRAAWIKSNSEALIAKTIYAVNSNPLAKQIYEYRKEGFPLGKSIGFVPVEWEDYDPKTTKGLKRKFNKVILLEYSDVPLPSNPDAVQFAVSKGLLKKDFTKMLYFKDLNLETKEKAMNEEKETIRDFCDVCNSEQEMIFVNDEYVCKMCGSKKKKKKELETDIEEKIAKREDVNPEEGLEKYGDVEFADERNKKYPLDTYEHVRAALSYWGMPKNRAKYSPEDQKKITEKIRRAARKFGIKVSDDEEEKEKSFDFDEILTNLDISTNEEVVKKGYLDNVPSVSDITFNLTNELNELFGSSFNGYIVDIFPYNYPDGKVIYRMGSRLYVASYSFDIMTGAVKVTDVNEVKEQYAAKSIFSELADLTDENEYLKTKIASFEDIIKKEGRVLSTRNRKLIEDCITALQNLLAAATRNNGEEEILEEDIETKSKEKEKVLELDDDELLLSKDEIEEVTKKVISSVKIPFVDVNEIVSKVEAKVKGKAVM